MPGWLSPAFHSRSLGHFGRVAPLPGECRGAWLMVIFSLLDEAIVLVLVVLGLWYFDVKISWPLGLVVGLLMVAFVFVVHKAIIPSLLRRKLTGREGMIGLTGRRA